MNCVRATDLSKVTIFCCSAAMLLSPALNVEAASQPAEGQAIRCVLIEIYYRDEDAGLKDAIAAVEKLRSARGGIELIRRNVSNDPRNQERLSTILRHFKVSGQTSTVIYGCNRIIHGATAAAAWESRLQELLQVEVFVRSGCSRCTAAEEWLPKFLVGYPGLKPVYRDIATNAREASRMSQLSRQHQTAAASVPVFHLCDNLIVGFDRPTTTGERLRNLLKRWTIDCPVPPVRRERPANQPMSRIWFEPGSESWLAISDFSMIPVLRISGLVHTSLTGSLVLQEPRDVEIPQTETDPPRSNADIGDLPLPGDDLPGESESDFSIPLTDDESDPGDTAEDQIELPVFGRLSASRLGMPLFTIAVGLVDGFNPCAMWVLMFLLSILVNLKDRTRILAIAGTFVVVSGLAYFAFMAAWLNVFMLIGFLRPIQIGLALVAIVIGSIHVKDFFAFRQGISLSIPESAKPGIYSRVRRIVTAEHMTGAIAGAITLAILVNVIELLCTAGLPALYTNILMQQGFSSGVKYAYLALYILAYMFDDGLMVGIVVFTLSKRKLQEGHGRLLKLISGLAILLLGIIMLFRPEWLH